MSKRYDKPATPCDRLLAHPAVDATVKEALRERRSKLDHVKLLHRIRDAQAALADLASQQLTPAPRHDGFEQFLSQLPRLWRLGEVRPTHSKRKAKRRYWRTREDPFEGVWSEVSFWLQQRNTYLHSASDRREIALSTRLKQQHLRATTAKWKTPKYESEKNEGSCSMEISVSRVIIEQNPALEFVHRARDCPDLEPDLRCTVERRNPGLPWRSQQ